MRNIVWIVTTQWRADAMSCLGNSNVTTPAIDSLARHGKIFRQAVTPHPMGPQARAALLTGKLSPGNGVNSYWDELPEDIPTIALQIASVGYQTAHFGKWHLSSRDPSAPFVGENHATQIVRPENRGGFSFWEGFESGFLLNDPFLHGTRLPTPTRFLGYQSDVLLERAADWLAGQNGGPNFCVLSLEAPHPPYEAPTPLPPLANPRLIRLTPNVPAADEVERKARRELAGYFSHVEATDRSIGRFIKKIDLQNTMLVFTSVHGDMHGAHGLFRKGWPYEESIRIPLIIHGPLCGPGNFDDSLVSLNDLPSMALSWSQGEVWNCSRDYAQISMPSIPKIPLQCDRIWSGIRNSREKIIVNSDGSPWLCFDLVGDPFEMDNLVGQPHRKETVDRLLQCARKFLRSSATLGVPR